MTSQYLHTLSFDIKDDALRAQERVQRLVDRYAWIAYLDRKHVVKLMTARMLSSGEQEQLRQLSSDVVFNMRNEG